MVEFTAVILAASQGDRLYPLTGAGLMMTDEGRQPAAEEAATTASSGKTKPIPKHLLPIGGEPVLARLLQSVVSSGFEECVILAGPEMESDIIALKDKVDLGATCACAVDVIALPPSCSGSADALRHLYSVKGENIGDVVVMPGDLVVEGQGLLGWLVDAHRRARYGKYASACTMLLSDVGEEDADGMPLKESAKAKKGGFSRDEEDIEFIGTTFPTVDCMRRVVLKQSKVDVEEDEDFVGKTPKLIIPKAKLEVTCGLNLRTDLLDIHVYVFAPWVRHLLDERRNITSLQEDLVPLLVSRQFSGIASTFGNNASALDHDLKDDPFAVVAQVLPRGPRLALRACTIPSYLFACREIVAHSIKFPDNPLTPGFERDFDASLTSTLKISNATFQQKTNSVLLEGVDYDPNVKMTIKNSTIGRRVKIGVKCKLNNVVIMDDVVVGNETILQNTVVSEGCVVGDNCNLNDCQVGPGAQVEAFTKVKGEAIVQN